MEKSQKVERENQRVNSRGRINGMPNPVDVYVGKRIYQRRMELNLSQEQMSKMLGISFQQIQKYEKGFNRISASRLWDVSEVLGVSVNYFFEGIDDKISENSPRNLFVHTELDDDIKNDPMRYKETRELVEAYYRIPDRKAANEILGFLKEMW